MLSIIIPTFNRNELLRNCLDHVHVAVQKVVDSVNYEVIVTDDSKEHAAKEIIDGVYDWVQWIAGPQRGPASNRNNGAVNANGEWLIFIDDDCLPQEEWLSAYVDVINSQRHLVYEGKTIADRKKRRFDEESPLNLEGNKLWSCNFAIRKELFMDLGGFDEGFKYAAMEDVDFYTRVIKVSSILFVPEAVVVHPWRRIVLFKDFKKHLESHKYFVDKHQSGGFNFRWSRTKIFVGGAFINLAELIKFSMKGWPVYIEKCLLNLSLIFI